MKISDSVILFVGKALDLEDGFTLDDALSYVERAVRGNYPGGKVRIEITFQIEEIKE